MRLLWTATTAAIITVKQAPIPINRRGMSRSHWPDGDVVVAVAVVEVEFVRVLVPLAEVMLLVAVGARTLLV